MARFDLSFMERVEEILKKNGKTPISSLYDEFLWEEDQWEKTNKPRSKDFVHASSLGYCARSVVLDMMGFPHQKTAAIPTYRLFANGHFFHDRMQQAMIEMGVLYDAELKVFAEKYRVGGAIDGKMKPQGVEELVEFKSINGFSFDKSELPLESHKTQVSVYMYATGIHRTRFYYECKNTQRPKEIVYDLETDVLKRGLVKATYILKFVDKMRATGVVDNDSLPMAPCITKSQPEAQRCLMRQACFSFL